MSKDGRVHSFLFKPDQYCTNHQGMAPREGGKDIIFNNGRSKRWMCAACIEKRSERMKAVAEQKVHVITVPQVKDVVDSINQVKP